MSLLRSVPLAALTIEDEDELADVPPYGALKQALLRAGAHYRVPAPGSVLSRWDQVLLLNLAFWTPGEPDDVIEGRTLTADVVAHRAWHHLAHAQLGPAAGSVAGLMLGESIASAFDVYLVGTLLRTRPDAQVLQSQVPAMTTALQEAGLSDPECEAFFERCAAQPGRAFGELRGLLYEVGVSLVSAQGVEAAAAVLQGVASHPMAPLLHHFELPTWTLYARAHASGDGAGARALHEALLAAPEPLSYLIERWLS